jgi:hypothetical protein
VHLVIPCTSKFIHAKKSEFDAHMVPLLFICFYDLVVAYDLSMGLQT